MGPTFDIPTQSTAKTAHLLPFLPNVLERVAPERAPKLEMYSEVVVQVVDAEKPAMYAMPGQKVIILSTRTIDLVWAMTYAHWSFYTRYLVGTMPSGTTADLTMIPALNSTRALLSWARSEMQLPSGSLWPNNLPHPVARSTFSPMDEATDERVVDELTFLAIAFMLHHELAHIYTSPGIKEYSIDHERACDLAASEWIFGERAAEGDRATEKRAIGSAVALLFIASLDLTRTTTPKSHPIGVERLVDVLDTWIDESRESVWALVCGILALHATDAGVSIPQIEYPNFREATIAYRDAVRARLN